MSGAYYNEHDPFAADWLRTLIMFDHIAPGDVDTRSIEDVTPDDLRGYDQCHWFAGIGVWSLALRQAGWSDDRPAWTGSCPCQPFSAAGKGAGFADERHLWPAWHWLIGQCRPDTLFGEQVEGPAGDRWFDLVSADLEGEGYACGQSVFPAAGVGAPHIRHRRYWLACATSERPSSRPQQSCSSDRQEQSERPSHADGLGDDDDAGLQIGSLAPDERRTVRDEGPASGETGAVRDGLVESQSQQEGLPGRSRLAGGPWSDPDWIWCRDGKYRPVEPGTFPLVAKYPGRVGALRGYGNALCAEAARVFVEEAMKCL